MCGKLSVIISEAHNLFFTRSTSITSLKEYNVIIVNWGNNANTHFLENYNISTPMVFYKEDFFENSSTLKLST